MAGKKTKTLPDLVTFSSPQFARLARKYVSRAFRNRASAGNHVANACDWLSVRVDRSRSACERPVVARVAVRVRNPVVALPRNSNAVHENV